MLSKHAKRKVSPISVFWETPVSLEKKFHRSRSPFVAVSRYAPADADKASTWPSHIVLLPIGTDHVERGRTDPSEANPDETRDDGNVAAVPETESPGLSPRPAVMAARSNWMLQLQVVARCAACLDFASANLPIAIVSWIISQFFAGCAAYAEAMYPSIAYVPQSDDSGRRDAQPGRLTSAGSAGQSPGLASDLQERSRFGIEHGIRPRPRSTGRGPSAVTRSGGTAKIVRLAVRRPAPSGRLVTLGLIIKAWLSRWRRGHGRAVFELHKHDRRALRDARFSR
jgi:hypothetical protein